jgi:hypothetical protein
MGAIACVACGAMVGEGLDECPSCGANPVTGLWGAPAQAAVGTSVSSRAGRPEGAFGTAIRLYFRNILWLVLAGVIAMVVEIGLSAVVQEIAVSIGYAAARGIATGASPSVRGYAAGVTVVTMAGGLAAQLVLLVLRGGLLKMAIDSERDGHSARLETLFAGFPRFLSYAGLWAAMAVPCAVIWGISYGSTRVMGPLALPVTFACGILLLYLFVTWVYALPLIADRKLGPLEALSRSGDMVGNAGWWATLAPFFILGVVMWVVMYVLAMNRVFVVTAGGYAVYGVTELVFMPFVICLIASMYLGSEPRRVAPAVAAPAGPAPTETSSARSTVSPAQASPVAGASRQAAAPITPDAARIAAAAAAWASTPKPTPAPEAGSAEH